MVVKAVHCAQAMPQSHHNVLALRSYSERLRMLFRRGEQRPAGSVWWDRGADSHTRTFWARDAAAPATLVEAEPVTAAERRPDRVAAMIAAHDSGRLAGEARRPRGNPAFAEAVFVELMRAHQYRRAFEQLSAECRRSWGSADAFAAAQGDGSMNRLRGMRVTDVRYLPEWTDSARGTTHRDVAELAVEYTLGDRAPVTVPRVVHLVADDGRWRSICYPD